MTEGLQAEEMSIVSLNILLFAVSFGSPAQLFWTQLTRLTLIPLVMSVAARAGLEVSKVEFASVETLPSGSPVWKAVLATVHPTTAQERGIEMRADVDSLGLRIERLLPPQLEVRMSQARISFEEGSAERPIRRSSRKQILNTADIRIASLRMIISGSLLWKLPIRGSDFKKTLESFLDNEHLYSVEAEGDVRCQIKNREVILAFTTEDQKGEKQLTLDKRALRELSPLYREKLTDSELAIIANHPFRAATLLRIKERAESTSQQARIKDATVPEDAYRHVLWSYLLASRYGEEFAKRVTDAHEIGETADHDTDEDHRMDYHNNRLGRSYAKLGLNEADILKRIRSGTEAILSSRRQPPKAQKAISAKLSVVKPHTTSPEVFSPMNAR